MLDAEAEDATIEDEEEEREEADEDVVARKDCAARPLSPRKTKQVTPLLR